MARAGARGEMGGEVWLRGAWRRAEMARALLAAPFRAHSETPLHGHLKRLSRAACGFYPGKAVAKKSKRDESGNKREPVTSLRLRVAK